MATVITTARIKDCIQQRPSAVPYGILASSCFYSAFSILKNGINTGALSAEKVQHFSRGTPTSAAALTLATFIGWGIGSVLLAHQDKKGTSPTNPLGNAQLYNNGSSGILAGQTNLIAAPFFAVAFAKAVLSGTNKDKKIEVKSPSDFIKKHVTPARLGASGFVITATTVALSKNWVGMIPPLLFAWGYTRFDAKLDKEIGPDLRQARAGAGPKPAP